MLNQPTFTSNAEKPFISNAEIHSFVKIHLESFRFRRYLNMEYCINRTVCVDVPISRRNYALSWNKAALGVN